MFLLFLLVRFVITANVTFIVFLFNCLEAKLFVFCHVIKTMVKKNNISKHHRSLIRHSCFIIFFRLCSQPRLRSRLAFRCEVITSIAVGRDLWDSWLDGDSDRLSLRLLIYLVSCKCRDEMNWWWIILSSIGRVSMTKYSWYLCWSSNVTSE